MRTATLHDELRKLSTEFSRHAVHAPSLRHELLVPLHAMTAQEWEAFKALYLPQVTVPADGWKEWVPFPDGTSCSLYHGDGSGYHPFLGLAARGLELLGEAGAAAGGLTGGLPRNRGVHEWLRWVYETADCHGGLHLLTERFGQEVGRSRESTGGNPPPHGRGPSYQRGGPEADLRGIPLFGGGDTLLANLPGTGGRGRRRIAQAKAEGGGRHAGGQEGGHAAPRPGGPAESRLPREVSTAEASEILGVSKDTLLEYKRKGLLPFRNLAPPGSTKPVYMFPLDAVVQLRTTYQTEEPAPAVPHEPPRQGAKGRGQFKHLIIDEDA